MRNQVNNCEAVADNTVEFFLKTVDNNLRHFFTVQCFRVIVAHLSDFFFRTVNFRRIQIFLNHFYSVDHAGDFLSVLDNNFKRVSYTEAIDILKASKPNRNKKFKYIINEWGADLQSEHERFLVEKHFKCPVILFDYPADIKAFYMRLNEDEKTVRAMDILFPGIGDIVGGSQREERYDVLVEKMKALNIPEEEMWWYLDTRKFGTAVHSGFGFGFERMVLFVTGMTNIRDVIPYPRTPGNAEF